MNRTFTSVDDKVLQQVIAQARKRLVFVAPGIRLPVADALIRAMDVVPKNAIVGARRGRRSLPPPLFNTRRPSSSAREGKSMKYPHFNDSRELARATAHQQLLFPTSTSTVTAPYSARRFSCLCFKEHVFRVEMDVFGDDILTNPDSHRARNELEALAVIEAGNASPKAKCFAVWKTISGLPVPNS